MEERSPPLADLLRWMKSRNGRVLREAGTGVQRVFFFRAFRSSESRFERFESDPLILYFSCR